MTATQMRKKRSHGRVVAVYVTGLASVLSLGSLIAFLLILSIAMIAEQDRFFGSVKKTQDLAKNVRRRLFGSQLLLVLTAPLGLFGLVIVRAESQGASLMYLFWVSVMLSDVIAYEVGSRGNFRKSRIPGMSWLSPNKTDVGFASGYLAGVAAYLLGYWLLDVFDTVPLSQTKMLLCTFMVPLAGICGDLLFSIPKRLVPERVGDWSDWLGGHGGFCDRFDAFVIAALVKAIIVLA